MFRWFATVRAACSGWSRWSRWKLRAAASPTGRFPRIRCPACSTLAFLRASLTRFVLASPKRFRILKNQERLTFARCGITDPLSLSDYMAHGGYRGLEQALKLTPEAIVEEVTTSGLRGRGGAGFPTGIKWRTVLNTPADQKYIVCNADEGDSGTYADRMIMEGDPFVLIEGMTIAGMAVGATSGYIYLRSEYPHAFRTLQRAIAIAYSKGYLGADVAGSGKRFDLEVRMGAGAYICGEETSLLESLEGKRGQIRFKPPLPAIKGLFGKPTVVNNVISLATVPIILDKGGAYYRDFGMGKSRGTLTIQLAGNIKHGGLVEKAFGLTLRQAIYDFGGGTAQRTSVARRAGGRAARRLFPGIAARYAARLRSLRRKEGHARPRRHCRLRRHGRSRAAGALRDGILRHRKLRQVHALPRRFHARRRGDRQDHRQPGPHAKSGTARRSLRGDAGWVALRSRRTHSLSRAERDSPFSGRF